MLSPARRLGAVLGAGIVLFGGDARCEDAGYTLGRHGWLLEYYGADVTLLRSATAGAGREQDEAALFLSCDGTDRRLRLTLPEERFLPGLGAGSGSVLIRAVDRAGSVVSSLHGRFVAAGKAALLVTKADQPGARDPILGLARMLEGQPARLDLLLRPGGGRITLRGLTPLRLSPAYGPGDGIAFRGFVATCSQAGEGHKG